MAKKRVYDPALFLAVDHRDIDVTSPNLLILNQPIADFPVFARLWRNTKYRICADGGANRLYDMFEGKLEKQRADYLPNAIHGDLDSLRNDVRAYYAARGVEISQDHDQYSTDFGKAMHKISLEKTSSTPKETLVLGTLGGRVDQGLGLLHEMIREENRDPNLLLWLFSETNLSVILRKGHNLLQGLSSSELFTENVGIVPIYGPAIITTSGLEWNVKDWDTQMGRQVSTSNHVKADEVHIHTNAPVLFTIERAAMSTSHVAKQA
ncbi:thiamine pyrophosphokinase-like protein 1 [Lentithecium fluviatile CBS 122367]|uniref:Thiamine pyrophosphokinase n=1 Tax=Lentithecium fluviatile CBS 122367 TaxID=1168545 RepID=A0A6G1J1A8_9PLEO|nr:thiamine pyrophosphokinase-like protein 1 [Lentithecium fluviatile CBS 122367]